MPNSFPNPMGASAEIVHIGELAADFISAHQASVRHLLREAEALKAFPPSDERTQRAQQIASSMVFLQGIAKASSSSLASIWADITSALDP